MDSEPIQDLLRTADEQSHRAPGDAGALADRVLRVSHRRRARRIGAVVVLLFAASIFTFEFRDQPSALHSAPQLARENSKPAVAGGAEPDEFKQLQDQIALQELIVKGLERNEALSNRSARIAELMNHPNEDQAVERAAAVIVLQADRLLRQSGDPAPALQAYHEVITHFPQAISAEVARQRIAQIEKAG